MNTLDLDSPRPISTWSFPLISATLVSLILLFLDEGYLSFQWMTRWGNWMVFVIYLLILFSTQALILKFMAGKDMTRNAARLTSLAGIPVGLAILFMVFGK